ncbi:hypothetical protein ACFWHW_25295 [Streptomyces pharetrae]|uniref:hypothetical protein n=1 Tax=Streptomyces pharetrae TaxID=291370 RepID=UPI00365462FA
MITVMCRFVDETRSRRLSLVPRPAVAPSESSPPEEGLADVLALQRRAAAISDSADEIAIFYDAVAEYTWARDVAGLAATTLGRLRAPNKSGARLAASGTHARRVAESPW